MIPCIISDIDGTLADRTHRLHHVEKRPKNWKAWNDGMSDDAPNVKIINAYHFLRRGLPNAPGFLFTGRHEKFRAVTEKWLSDHFVSYDRLIMRADGDMRADDIVKGEMLDALAAEDYWPYMVLDDRDSVVRMWRSRGIVCLQVADGNF